MSLSALGLSEAAAEIREGRVTSTELVTACLDRIAEVEPDVQAFAFLDRDHALKQAKALDEHRAHGRPTGPLHGVPVAIKDVFDTGDYADRVRLADLGGPHAAAATRRRWRGCAPPARSSWARRSPPNTPITIPARPAIRTTRRARPAARRWAPPAAVAAFMVPGAIGTQTNGSTIRPAAYCGVVGFKPTHGLIPRTGALLLSRALDHVGVFARSSRTPRCSPS